MLLFFFLYINFAEIHLKIGLLYVNKVHKNNKNKEIALTNVATSALLKLYLNIFLIYKT